jgi:feruloyl esterase
MRILRSGLRNAASTASQSACIFAFIGSAWIGLSSANPVVPPVGIEKDPHGNRCQSLIQLPIEKGQVTEAVVIKKGEPVAGAEPAVNAANDVCRVRVQVRPTPGSDIGVEIWLPSDWNRKLYGIGGGGFDGAMQPGTVGLYNKMTEQGYATVATDVGHKAGTPLESWTHKQPEKIVDFGHRGVHLAAVVAKQVVAAYYGHPADRSYFVGCSNGGREAMMLASRYPADYDGIVAGAPAMRYLEVLTQMIWFNDAAFGPGGAPKFAEKLGLVNRAVLAKCDRLDGVLDGILENPLQCEFDPAELRCKANPGDDCLTDAEVTTFSKIYSGPSMRNGKSIYSGPSLGSEEGAAGWAGWIQPEKTLSFGRDFYRWMAFDDPDWKVENFVMDRDYPRALRRIGPVINANNPDLREFARRDGRLIMYQGWYDPGITAHEAVKYYDQVRQHLKSETDQHVRLFMVPGMAHCASGPGADNFDMFKALEAWVEKGEAPERIIASKPGSDPEFTRPLCPWPKTARYLGTGDTNDAANFKCD